MLDTKSEVQPTSEGLSNCRAPTRVHKLTQL